MILAVTLIGASIIAAPLWMIAIKLSLIWSVLQDSAIWPAAPGTTTTIRVTEELRDVTLRKSDTYLEYQDYKEY